VIGAEVEGRRTKRSFSKHRLSLAMSLLWIVSLTNRRPIQRYVVVHALTALMGAHRMFFKEGPTGGRRKMLDWKVTDQMAGQEKQPHRAKSRRDMFTSPQL